MNSLNNQEINQGNNQEINQGNNQEINQEINQDNNQDNNQDYYILDDKIIYNIDKFDVNKHLTYNVLTQETIQKTKNYKYLRSVIKLKENIDKKYNPYTINILCNPIKKSKGILIFNYDKNYNNINFYNYFYKDKYDPKRFFIRFYYKKNEISKLYKNLDKYFQSDVFRFNYFKEIGYNQNTKHNFSFNYKSLYSIIESGAYESKSFKLKFGVNKEKRIITTKIIIKDNKTNRMKEYSNLKFEDIDKIEKLFLSRNILIQPLINIYNIYSDNPLKPYYNKTYINYGILTKMKELTIYTNNFNYVIQYIFKDKLNDIDKKKVSEKNLEKKIKILKQEKNVKTSNNTLNIFIFIFMILLNNIVLFLLFKNC